MWINEYSATDEQVDVPSWELTIWHMMLCNSVQSSGEIRSYYEYYEGTFYIFWPTSCTWPSHWLVIYSDQLPVHGVPIGWLYILTNFLYMAFPLVGYIFWSTSCTWPSHWLFIQKRDYSCCNLFLSIYLFWILYASWRKLFGHTCTCPNCLGIPALVQIGEYMYTILKNEGMCGMHSVDFVSIKCLLWNVTISRHFDWYFLKHSPEKIFLICGSELHIWSHYIYLYIFGLSF